ncbi:Hypothetical predicted protein [Lecanosticta acicola]|uniref:Uncharacterized protein n=1 Tax=Lecanosticta acicola TaxID=111012 RepID=A0AAI9EEF5_9PEZI|nr:Hypothetical predicted protein [Lecanosticta acicola]
MRQIECAYFYRFHAFRLAASACAGLLAFHPSQTSIATTCTASGLRQTLFSPSHHDQVEDVAFHAELEKKVHGNLEKQRTVLKKRSDAESWRAQTIKSMENGDRAGEIHLQLWKHGIDLAMGDIVTSRAGDDYSPLPSGCSWCDARPAT